MELIGKLLINRTVESDHNQRRVMLRELFTLYCSPTQRKLRRIVNWKRYILWLKENKIPHTKETVQKFQKVRVGKNKFIREISDSSFAFLLAHTKTEGLHYVLSVARDKNNRGEEIGGWLFSKK